MTDGTPAGAAARLDRTSRLVVFVALLLSVLFIYGPAVFMYYPLLDDNWIVQSAAQPYWRYFTNQVVWTIQGRPLFAELILATSAFAGRNGVAALGVVRAVAALNLAVAMYLVVLWVRSCRVPLAAAALFGLVLATLPAYQIYVTGGPWLTVALVMSIGAAHLLARASAVETSIRRRAVFATASAALVMMALAFYQATPMIVFALLVWPVLASDLDDRLARARLIRLCLTTGAVMAAVIVVYSVAWRIAVPYYYPDLGAFNYGPSSLHLTTVFNHLKDVPIRRLPLVARLWSVETTGADFSGGQLLDRYSLAIGVCVGVGIGADLWRQRAGLSPARAVGRGLLRWLAVAGLFVAADTAAILSPTPVNSFYMSSAPLTLAAVTVLFQTMRSIAAATGALQQTVIVTVLSCAAVFGAFRAQDMVIQHFALPLTVEYRLVRNQIRTYISGHALCGIGILQNSVPLLGQGYSEFGWSNVNSGFYATRLVENALDELLQPRVHIESFVPSTAKTETDANQRIPKALPDCQPMLIDMSGLSLR